MQHNRPNLLKACEAVGGQTALGALIGKDQGFVWHLLNRANSIKADVAVDISQVSGVPLDAIIKDFFPTPSKADAA